MLPTGEHAVISYKFGLDTWFGVLANDKWYFSAKDPQGSSMADYRFSKTPLQTVEMLNADHRTGYTVHFAGVTK